MGSFRRGIRFVRSQEVIVESRLFFFRKRVSYKHSFVIMCYVLISFIFNWFIGLFRKNDP